MTIEIHKIKFSEIEAAGLSLKDKNPNWSLKEHAEEKDWDYAINAGMFSNGNPKTDPYYYWNIVDMVIDGVSKGGGNYSDVGLAFGNPFEGISAYLSKTAYCVGKPVDFLGGAPTLIIDGKKDLDMKGLSPSFATNYTQRGAIGVDARHIYLATTRKTKATLNQMVVALLGAGCKDAVATDGGYSNAFLTPKGDLVQGRNITSAFGIKLKKTTAPVDPGEKKVFISIGHGGSDPGASYNGLVEKDMNLVMGLACGEELDRHGVNVLLSRQSDVDDPLSDEIKECINFRPDCALACHNNAGRGDGFEAWYSIIGTEGKRLAQLLEKEIIAMGQNSRGVHTKTNSYGSDYYGFNREPYCPSVIAEAVFLDNLEDVKFADTVAEQKAVGVAYAKAILSFLGIAWVEKSFGDTRLWRVQVGAFANKSNADALLLDLKSKGFVGYVK